MLLLMPYKMPEFKVIVPMVAPAAKTKLPLACRSSSAVGITIRTDSSLFTSPKVIL